MAEKNKEKSVAKATRMMPSALDGGWAWMIVLGVSLAFGIAVGFSKCFTLIYQILLVRYGESDFATSWVPGLFGGFKMFTGPLVSSLCNMYGHRQITIAGGIITSVALIASAYAPSLSVLYITYGVIAGIGSNMMITPSYAIVCLYFDAKRGLAVSIASASQAVGPVIFAPLITFLLQQYGYSGTMLISGAIFLHYCISGAIYRPLKDNYPEHRRMLKSSQEKVVENDPLMDIKDEEEHPPKPLHVGLNSEKFGLMGSMRNIQLDGWDSVMDLNEAHKENRPRKSYANVEDSKNRSQSSAKDKLKKFIKSFDFYLLKDRTFTLLCMCMSAMFHLFYTNIIFLSGFASEHGLNADGISILLIILACADVPARLLSGVIFDCSFIRKHMVYSIVVICYASILSMLALAFSGGRQWMYVCWVVYQIFHCIVHSQHSNVVASLVPSEKITSAFGLLRFIQGMGMISAPVVGGLIKDSTGTYCYSFVSAVGVSFFFTTVFFIHFYLSKTNFCTLQTQLEKDNSNKGDTQV